MSKKLYRYVSFEDFVNLVVNNNDRFVRPICWDDKCEGYLFSHMKELEDVHKIVEEMYYKVCRRNYYAIPDNYFKMWHSKSFSYAQCWSKHEETDAMWRCYSYGNRAIRIKTSDEKLLAHAKRIFSDPQTFSIHLKEVIYDLDKKVAIDQQIAQMKDSGLAHETYFHKRPVFCHEGEYRLLIVDNRLFGASRLSSFGVKHKIEEQMENKSDEERIDFLTEKICSQRAEWNISDNTNVRIEKADDILEFIESIMVHPLAPKWYVDIVKDICNLREIKFDGQSKIYELK